MLGRLFCSLLITSAAGAVMTFIVVLIKKAFGKSFSRNWHCYVWMAALLVMMLPVRFSVPEIKFSTAPRVEMREISNTQNMAENVKGTAAYENKPTERTEAPPKGTEAKKKKINIELLSVIWLIGTVFMLIKRAVMYTAFCINMRRSSDPCETLSVKEYTKRRVRIRVSDIIPSPFMYGYIKPVLLLPCEISGDEQLKYILMHEFTHLKRADILYKWFAAFVSAVHWFNPAIYYITRQIDNECELACDYDVVRKMSTEEKLGYVDTILALLKHSVKKEMAFTTSMAGNKTQLEKRLINIRHIKGTEKFASVTGVVMVAFMSLSILAAGGVFADAVLPDVTDVIVRINGERVGFSNRPYMSGDALYMPLRESFERLGVMKSPESTITAADGVVHIKIAGVGTFVTYENASHMSRNDVYYQLEVGKAPLYISHSGEADKIKTAIMQKNTPQLTGGCVYVPFETLDYMVDGGLGRMTAFDMTCTVKGKNTKLYSVRDFVWPCPDNEVITRCYSPWAGHNGTDIKAAKGDAVVAVADGKIREHGFDSVRGSFVIMEDANKTEIEYHHLDTILKFAGDEVAAGETVGLVGSTGMATGEHLHFEIRTDGEYADPAMLFPFLWYSMKDPVDTVTKFFSAFENGAFERMKNYCTEECIDTYFKDSSVYGLKKAKLVNIDTEQLKAEYMKSSPYFSVFVMTESEAAPVSVFENESSASFYVCLVRQPDGRYIIDGFSGSVEWISEPELPNLIEEEMSVPVDINAQIQKSGKVIKNKGTLNLSGAVRVCSYSLDDRNELEVKLYPDTNGQVKLVFETGITDAVCDIMLSCDEKGNEIGARIPTSNTTEYIFDGLSSDTLYTFTMSGYYPGNYGIDGNVLIY